MNRDLPAPAPENGTLGVEDLRDDQILKLIERAAVDPVIAELVQYLQRQAYEKLDVTVQRVLGELNKMGGAGPGAKPSGPISVLALASEARQRETAGKERRELADMLVIGAAANRGNPDWDMFDDGPDAATPDSALLALLRFKPPGAA